MSRRLRGSTDSDYEKVPSKLYFTGIFLPRIQYRPIYKYQIKCLTVYRLTAERGCCKTDEYSSILQQPLTICSSEYNCTVTFTASAIIFSSNHDLVNLDLILLIYFQRNNQEVLFPNMRSKSSRSFILFAGIYRLITCWEEANPINCAIRSDVAPACTALMA